MKNKWKTISIIELIIIIGLVIFFTQVDNDLQDNPKQADTKTENQLNDSNEKLMIKSDVDSELGQGENFDHFIYKYCTDSIFQMSRTKFPLKASFFIDFELDNLDTLLPRDSYNFDPIFFRDNYKVQIYDNFKGQIKNTDQRLVSYEGIENGIDINYFFERIEKKWFLIEFIDNSN
jgi:hypothetical protein